MKRLYYCECCVNGYYSSRYVLAKNKLHAAELVVRYYRILHPDCSVTDVSFSPVEHVSEQIIKTYLNQYNGNN